MIKTRRTDPITEIYDLIRQQGKKDTKTTRGQEFEDGSYTSDSSETLFSLQIGDYSITLKVFRGGYGFGRNYNNLDSETLNISNNRREVFSTNRMSCSEETEEWDISKNIKEEDLKRIREFPK